MPMVFTWRTSSSFPAAVTPSTHTSDFIYHSHYTRYILLQQLPLLHVLQPLHVHTTATTHISNTTLTTGTSPTTATIVIGAVSCLRQNVPPYIIHLP